MFFLHILLHTLLDAFCIITYINILNMATKLFPVVIVMSRKEINENWKMPGKLVI